MRISDWSSDVCSSDLVKDIATAVAIVREAGCGAVALDVLHLMRNGADIAAVAPNAGLIGYVQVSDGPLELPDEIPAWHEAVKERLLPGDGAFPLAEILRPVAGHAIRSEEHTSELQSLMRTSYAVFCLKKKNKQNTQKIKKKRY